MWRTTAGRSSGSCDAGAVGETYNVGGRNEWKNLDIVRLLCRLVDEAFGADAGLARRFPRAPAAKGRPTDSLVTFVKDRPGHDRRYAIDASRIEADLGFTPTRDASRPGIRKTLALVSGERGVVAGGDGRELPRVDAPALSGFRAVMPPPA